ncbi:MAG: hypothetical protein AAF989_09640 [Planctomycetota bacterium]
MNPTLCFATQIHPDGRWTRSAIGFLVAWACLALGNSPSADGQVFSAPGHGSIQVHGSIQAFPPPVFVDNASIRSHPSWTDVAARVLDAVETLDESKLPDFTASGQEVLQRIAAADEFLRRSTDDANYKNWLTYLDWQPLADAIEEESPPSTQGRLSVELLERMVGLHAGLELSRLRQLRTSTQALVAASRYNNRERSIDVITKQLTALSERIAKMDGIPSTEDAAAINAVVGILVEANQTPGLVATLRGSFLQPNFRVHVPEHTVQAAVQRNVNQARPVNDCILGTRLFGTARVQGDVQADLVPSVGTVRMTLNLRGRFRSDNIGYNGPVSLNTVGDGLVNVTRSLDLTEQGATLSPAVANVSLTTRITSINHRLRFVRRIARKRAAQQKPQTDAIAREKLRRQVSQSFVDETNQATSAPPPDVMANVRPILQRLDIHEPTRQLASSDTAMFLWGQFASPSQLGSANAAPVVSSGTDIALQVHESIVENTVAPLLSGRTFDRDELNRLLAQAGVTMPPAESTKDSGESGDDDLALGDEEVGSDPAEEDFTLRFARFRPVVFECRQQTLRLGIRGAEFTQGKRKLRRAMEISATYVPVQTTDGQHFLLREEEIEISFSGRKRLSLSESAIKSAIKERFSRVFPETLLTKSYTVPQTISLPAFRGRVYRAGSIDSQDGWLTIGAR